MVRIPGICLSSSVEEHATQSNKWDKRANAQKRRFGFHRFTNMKKLIVGMLLVVTVGAVMLPVCAEESVSIAALRASVDYKMELLISKRVQLEKSVKELEEDYERILREPVINPNNPTPFYTKHLNGQVLKIDHQWNFIIIDLGNKNKITVGKKTPREVVVALPEKLIMNVIRGKKFIGTVKVTRVNDQTAVCDISSVTGGRQIRPGDRVLAE